MAASQMRQRIISKGNRKLTHLVWKRKDSTPDEDQEKIDLHKFLKTLWSELVEDSTNNILSVTNDGDDLIANNPVNSQDVIESIMDLYE